MPEFVFISAILFCRSTFMVFASYTGIGSPSSSAKDFRERLAGMGRLEFPEAEKMSTLTTRPDSLQNLADDDNFLRQELRRLAAAQAELLQSDTSHEVADGNETEQLRAENAELRSNLEQLDQAWGERQREYETMLEEKSEIIRNLHLKIQQLQEGGLPPVEAGDPEDLFKLQRELEEQRRQIKEDEEALMVQMGQMEMAMSRERAELARQRTELQRLQADLNREIEVAARDGGIRERIQALRKPHEQSPRVADGRASPSVDTPPPKKKSSGLLRRLFG
jgi:chromosome segregation ATPase